MVDCKFFAGTRRYAGADAANRSKTDSAHTKALCRNKKLGELERFQKKRLFWTDKGRFGFTAESVEPGDLVCVFDGAVILHVIRKVASLEDGEERWRFVGDAFVDGLMSAQADGIDVDGEEFCIV